MSADANANAVTGRAVFGLVATGSYSCFPGTSKDIFSRKVFATRAGAEAALPAWLADFEGENHALYGRFIPRRSQIVTFDLVE